MKKAKSSASRSGDDRRPDNYKQAQNRLRGVVSLATSQVHGLPKGAKRDVDQIFTDGIRRVLLEIRRANLSDEDQARLVRWASAIKAEGISTSKSLLAFNPGRRVFKSKSQSVSQELLWLIARLGPFVKQLAEFRSLAMELDAAFWKGAEPEAWKCLSEIEQKFGDSIWTMELRLALSQFYLGLDAQKAALKGFKDKYPGALPSFLAHFFSIRNETGSTIRLFRDDATRRLERLKVHSQAKAYFKYKIADDFSILSETLSSILRSEQSQSVIDIYETTVDILQRLVRTRTAFIHRTAIIKCLEAWRPIRDFRLTKLAWALGVGCDHTLPFRSSDALEALLNGNFEQAFAKSRREHLANPGDILSGIEVVSIETSKSDDAAASYAARSPWKLIAEPIRSVLYREEGFEESLGLLDKFCRNFRGLIGAAAVGDFIAFATSQGAATGPSLGGFNLNLANLSVWDLLNAEGHQKGTLELALTKAGVEPQLIKVLSGDASGAVKFDLPGASAILRALGLVSSDTEGAYLSLLDVVSAQIPALLRGLLISRRIELALHLGEMATAVADIAFETAQNPSSRLVLPVEQALEGRGWADLSSKNSPLDLAISLDVAKRKTNSDVYGTFLRFAFEDFLAAEGVNKASNLILSDHHDRAKLIYLLENIAVPEVMDLTGAFSSSAEVIDEREAVCKLLSELNPEKFLAYEEEIKVVEKVRLIQEGLRIIDYSRVNVDTPAISRWAEQRYKESYSRYRALLEAGIGIADDLEEVMRKVAPGTDRAGEIFYTPDNEADALLLEMIFAIRDQFLNNDEYGLEFFLGKRIRHGTITGHLRGPVERVGLITQRDDESRPYNANEEWLSKLQFASPEERKIADSAFRTFSEMFDDIAKRLKDDYLHVKSKRHPKGVFDFVVTQLAFQIIRSAIRNDPAFEEFVGSCYVIFWSLLDTSLSRARFLLSPEAKDEAAALFDELQNVIRENAVHDENYGEFAQAVRTAAVDVQRQFDSMLDWFTKREVEQVARRFSLSEVVDIAIRSTLKANRGYHPKFDTAVDEFVFAPVSLLVAISDILDIVISNACIRSKSGHEPEIAIECRINARGDAIVLQIVNSVGQEYDHKEAAEALTEIRRKIQEGETQKGAQQERRSGLLKIAGWTLAQGGSLDFGFVGNEAFRTTVDLRVVTQEGKVLLLPNFG